MERVPNELIHATSPYLLQHAYNPVNWYPWGEEALKKARDENKLLIISVGYSSCHWCHVMEHESFEDVEVATVMNKSFVCIKVDREERPDIDQVYMDAVQLMTGRGGWPLNVIALPDQRPLYGGTYFPKEQWRETLLQLAAVFRNDPAKCDQYASELTAGVQKLGKIIVPVDDADRMYPDHAAMLDRWSKQWDREEGGMLRAPKFPMPDSYRYLLAAGVSLNNKEAEEQVFLTLRKMAEGGIYDQLGGGFARYSTDMIWKVPHFEKMLYDNAQLISLYAEAFKRCKLPLFREVVQRTVSFLQREMLSPAGGFYSALDADSEGVEGKFYCWNLDEVNALLKEDAALAMDYFELNEKGYWEHDLYIPLQTSAPEKVAEKYGLTLSELDTKINSLRELLFNARASRVRPGLDDKILCSWNALCITGLTDAYAAFSEPLYLDLAKKNAAFVLKHFVTKDFHLLHTAKDTSSGVQATISGFMDDYATVIEAFLQLHVFAPEMNLLTVAQQLTSTAIREFSDEESGFFWFTAQSAEQLIARKMEVQDNVISSSNAIMMHNLLRLARLTDDLSEMDRVRGWLRAVKEDVLKSTAWYSRWARVYLEMELGTEVEVYGEDGGPLIQQLLTNYTPLSVFSLYQKPDHSEKSRGRYRSGETLIYVCRDKTCHAPVRTVDEALNALAV